MALCEDGFRPRAPGEDAVGDFYTALRELDIIECRAPMFKDPKATVELVREHYGHAGKVFIDFLLNLPDFGEVKRTVDVFQKFLREKTDISDKLIAALAHLATADYLSSIAVFGLDVDTAKEQAKELIVRISEGMITRSEMDEVNRAWDFVTGWVVGNGNHFEEDTHVDVNGMITGGERSASTRIHGVNLTTTVRLETKNEIIRNKNKVSHKNAWVD